VCVHVIDDRRLSPDLARLELKGERVCVREKAQACKVERECVCVCVCVCVIIVKGSSPRFSTTRLRW